jgi:hypothetical protein
MGGGVCIERVISRCCGGGRVRIDNKRRRWVGLCCVQSLIRQFISLGVFFARYIGYLKTFQ